MKRSFTARAAVPVVVAVVVNLVLLALGRAADASFVLAARNEGGAPMEIGVAEVIIATLVPLVIGLVAFALAVRRWPDAARWFRVAAVVLTVVSLAAPLTVDTDSTTRLWLALMHPVAGAAFLVATRRAEAGDVTSEQLTRESLESSR